MRNSLIAFVVFLLIIGYSFFSFFYLNNFSNSFEKDVITISSASENNKKNIKLAQENFKNKKNILLLMVSKEYIQALDSYLISLDIAIKYENSQDIDEYQGLLLNTLKDLDDSNHSLG